VTSAKASDAGDKIRNAGDKPNDKLAEYVRGKYRRRTRGSSTGRLVACSPRATPAGGLPPDTCILAVTAVEDGCTRGRQGRLARTLK